MTVRRNVRGWEGEGIYIKGLLKNMERPGGVIDRARVNARICSRSESHSYTSGSRKLLCVKIEHHNCRGFEKGVHPLGTGNTALALEGNKITDTRSKRERALVKLRRA